MVKIVYGNSLDLVAVESIASYLNTNDIEFNTKTDVGNAQSILNTLNEDLVVVGGENVCGISNLLVSEGTILPAPINFCGGIIRLANVNGNRIFACTGGAGDIDILPICEFGPEPSRIGTLACITEIMEKGLNQIWVSGIGQGYFEVSPDKVGDQFVTVEIPIDIPYQAIINANTGEINSMIIKALKLEGINESDILSFVTESGGKLYAVIRLKGTPTWLATLGIVLGAVAVAFVAIAGAPVWIVIATGAGIALVGGAMLLGSKWVIEAETEQEAVSKMSGETAASYLNTKQKLEGESSLTGGISDAIRYAGIGLVLVGGIYVLASMGVFGEKTKKSTRSATKSLTSRKKTTVKKITQQKQAKPKDKKVVKRITEYYSGGKKRTKVETK